MVISRRLQGYGYTRLVSLPKYWVEQQNLEKGDRVILIINDDGSLTIKKDNRKKVFIDKNMGWVYLNE